ncbi:MAG: hypothetical protein ACI8S6_004660 [Myxococcota bacterium]|jgi:hypothetical protein
MGNAFAIMGGFIMLIVMYRFLFKVPDRSPAYAERTRTGMQPVGAGEELTMIFGAGTPSLGPPPPVASLEPTGTVAISPEELGTPPWSEEA